MCVCVCEGGGGEVTHRVINGTLHILIRLMYTNIIIMIDDSDRLLMIMMIDDSDKHNSNTSGDDDTTVKGN